ncbi:amidohydrolase family protein [Rhodococcus sp. AD45-ID]|uniref:metal-dependent hydrolase family protein n=1 Tax=unclassified Rhodococcus (in: high G+C Gram-positive bacteria) TaxID=192944 RepID=UPI0005DB663E|nr:MULTISPECIES: amidohydrolase family protein [unclassified Rhodococcus (in: high G+C Gram-positive bacteria)]KJF25172.1 Melamine deaminase [Rhodococcus sp. AD45]MDV8065814.1 amidohydrolase family protein [Rhodococcus sp. IEGM 1366]PSR43359.1 amidohydrolase family protein [Rhodococcus sp. AD45-ID]RZL26786.1 MAG: amidohydrolase family protein [Rhodococcus sp. (in: high G+C Gram-positive bacteria)]
MHTRVINAHTLEPSTGERQKNAWIDIADGRIVDSGVGRPPASPGDIRIIDAGGGTVMPGLVDAHVHILVTTTNTAEIAGWTPGYATVRALRSAGDMLRRGFTTVRDVGGADHGMARALQEGLVPGPRLIFGGKALSQTGGHGDFRSLNDTSVPCCQLKPDFGRIADGVDAVRHAARDEFRKGAHHLKLVVSGGVASPTDEISAVQYTQEEIRAAVIEAENHNRYVTVHAYHPRSVNQALRAGVRCVEHGNLIDDESIRLLVENDAFLVPTIITYEAMYEAGAASGLSAGSLKKLDEVRTAAVGALEQAHRAGVNLVYGTDLLGHLQTRQLEEFTIRARVQPILDVIRSATSTAARLLGMEGEIGTLAPGAHADLLVLDGDPEQDLTVLTTPERYLRHVIHGGDVTDIAK